MKEFFKSKRFKVLLVILFLLIGVTVAAVESIGISNVSNQIVTTMVAPIKAASSSIASSVTQFFEQFTKASAYYEENQELKKEIQELKDENVELKKYKSEYEAMAEVAGLHQVNLNIDYLPALVTGRDPLDKTGSFTIGKGSVDGVALGDPVITSDGLIGRVDEVNTWDAHVSTIYNPKLHVGVYCVESLDRGTTSGSIELSGNGQCLMTGIGTETPIKAGDTVITYGSEYYPRDLAIGKVVEVKRDEGGLSNTAVIQVSVDIFKVREVIVITDFEGQASPEVMKSDIQIPSGENSAPESEISASSLPSSPVVAPPVSSEGQGNGASVPSYTQENASGNNENSAPGHLVRDEQNGNDVLNGIYSSG